MAYHVVEEDPMAGHIFGPLSSGQVIFMHQTHGHTTNRIYPDLSPNTLVVTDPETGSYMVVNESIPPGERARGCWVGVTCAVR